MGRPLVLSNGNLHVGINNFGLVHDFYYPRVGLENHAAGQSLRHKVGIWADDDLSWLDGGDWEFQFAPMTDSLIGRTVAHNHRLGVSLEFDDFVASDDNVFFRNVHVINHKDAQREIRIFMHQAFAIGDSRSNTDTAQYLPDSNAILHYRGNRAFMVSGITAENFIFDQHSIGLFGIEGREGTYRDADDGELSNGNVEHGRVDSTLRFVLHVDPHGSSRLHYWIACGRSTREAINLHGHVVNYGLTEYEQRTHAWWHEWMSPARQIAETLPKNYQSAFLTSILIVKSHIDNGGAVVASTDSTMLNQSRDAYAYCWPRDAALALWPLIRIGYHQEARRFFEFCKDALHPSGYLSHKYMADGSLGPSWHPYAHGDMVAPPIQEDETAITLFVFAQLYFMQPDRKLLDDHFESLIKPMADFMAGYINEKTHLPLPSYELWEEKFIVSTYSVAVTQASLYAAAELADIVGASNDAVSWRTRAEDMQKAASERLVDPATGALVKGLIPSQDGYTQDTTIDVSSLAGAFIYGLFSVNSDVLTNTMKYIEERIGSKDSPGLPRYENDVYYRQAGTTEPNYWFITSLWRAQYWIEAGNIIGAQNVIDWVLTHTTDSGILSEQLSPHTAEPLSVSPLNWSHAELLSTLMDLRSKE